MSGSRFVTDYAKSARAKCRKCDENIEKGALRLAMMVQSNYRDGKDPHWHHFDCFFAKPRGLTSTAALGGFGGLRPDDQAKVADRVDAATTPGAAAKKRKAAAVDVSPGGAKRAKVTVAAAKTPFAVQSEVFWIIKDELEANASIQQLRDMLKRNRVHLKGGERKETLVPRTARLIQFGVPPKCPECDSPWRMRFSEDSGKWYCGARLEYSRCPHEVAPEDLETEPFALPKKKPSRRKKTKAKTKTMTKSKTKSKATTKAKKKAPKALKMTTKTAKTTRTTRAQKTGPASAVAATLKENAIDNARAQRVTRRTTRSAKVAAAAAQQDEDELEEEDAQNEADKDEPQQVQGGGGDDGDDGDDDNDDDDGDDKEEECASIGTPFEQSMARLAGQFAKPQKPVGRSDAGGPAGASVAPAASGIFAGLIFAHARPAKEIAKSELGDARALIEKNGGTWSARVTAKVSYLIEIPDKYSEATAKVKNARKNGVHVVRESFVKHCIANKTLLDSRKYRLDIDNEDNDAQMDDDIDNEAADEKEVVPEGARVAVHRSARKELGEDVRVLDLSGDAVFHAVLSQADILSGRNSYYKLQVLLLKGRYWVSREYGRTGTAIRNSKLTPHTSASSAIIEFQRIFAEKTGNDWDRRNLFEKRPGKMEYIETRLLDAAEAARALAAKDPKVAAQRAADCKLHQRVVDLIELIFDKKLMESAMLEMEIDLSKFPLGALTPAHVEKGYKTLSEIADVLSGETASRDDAHKNQQLLTLSNKFFHIIPSQAISLIDSAEKVAKKVELVDALRDMEVAARFLGDTESAGQTTRSEAEEKYDKLKTRLEPLEAGGADWSVLDEWVQNTSRRNANRFGGAGSLKLVDAYTVSRDGEDARFAKKGGKLDNHKLLWHGSRTSNYCGILSQGLRIAPPEAPCSGYRFGKGVYFADLISKSASYCRTAGSSDMLIMACEVALGKEYEAYRNEYMEKPRQGTNSTHAMGSRVPDPAQDFVTRDDITVPRGSPVENGVRSSCSANEFIVYDVSQIRIRYLLRLSTDSSRPAATSGPVVLPSGEDATPAPALLSK